ncbi:hypothetical protein [Gemmobacter sp.]|uniref:hypothetical protein n=1 Tax=Gemmobacter sp. TaxID=1898957 RepID=UPI002AFE0718|nr:hypothetical protein [Gemmobacter sp.]
MLIRLTDDLKRLSAEWYRVAVPFAGLIVYDVVCAMRSMRQISGPLIDQRSISSCRGGYALRHQGQARVGRPRTNAWSVTARASSPGNSMNS